MSHSFARLAVAASAAASLLLALSGCATAQSPFVGTWDTASDGGGSLAAANHFEAVITVTESDGAYTVDVQNTAPPLPPGLAEALVVSDVVVDGGSFSFNRSAATPQGMMVLTFEGTVTGDTLAGTVRDYNAPALGVFVLTGKRR